MCELDSWLVDAELGVKEEEALSRIGGLPDGVVTNKDVDSSVANSVFNKLQNSGFTTEYGTQVRALPILYWCMLTHIVTACIYHRDTQGRRGRPTSQVNLHCDGGHTDHRSMYYIAYNTSS